MKVNERNFGVKRDSIVAFRLHPKVKEALADAAAAKNISVSQYCEKLVVRELKREGITVSTTVTLI